MKITASNYDKARGLLDDPELEDGLRSELQAELQAYETAKMTGSEFGAAPRMQTSLEALESGGFHKPKSREEWDKQYRLRKEPGLVDKETARQIDEGMRAAYIEDDPENTVVNPGQAPRGMEAEFYENARDAYAADPPEGGASDALSRLAKAWNYTPEGEDSFTVVDGDPRAAYLKQIEEQGEADKLNTGAAGIDDALPSASKRTDLYAPPEFIPRGVGLMDAATAGYFEEPPLGVVREALRGKLGPAADDLTEESDQYKRFADALWKSTYEEAEKTGRPVVRIQYMNTDDWVGKAAQLSARALGKALPVAAGIDRSLTGGLASEALAGGIDTAAGREVVRSGMHESAEKNPWLTGTGAVLGALAPGGLVGRTYSTTAGAIAKPGAGLARRLAGSVVGGAATGAVGSVAPDLVQNLGEAAFASNPRYKKPGDIMGDATASAGVGAALGPVGELIGTGAARGVRAIRESRRGAALADLEEAGMTTGGLLGANKSDKLAEIERNAARAKRHPEDVMVDPVAEGVGAEALRRQEETLARLAAEKQQYFLGAGRREMPATKILDQVNDEIAGLTRNGNPLPGRENDVRMLMDWRRDLSGSSRRMNAEQLLTTIEGLEELAKKGGDHNPAPFKRVLEAAMRMRDDFPKPGEAAMRKGDISAEGNLSAMMMRHDVELQALRARNEGAGLPRTLKPRPEAEGAPGPAKPQLTQNEDSTFRNTIAKYRRADTREAKDNALVELASGAGLENELKQIAGSNALKEIREASRMRSVFGSQGTMSLYSGNPLEVLALRADPALRALSKREPAAGKFRDRQRQREVSFRVVNILRRLTGKDPIARSARSLDPLKDIATGARGRGSARQLGGMASAGYSGKRDKYTIDDLSSDEQELLLRLVELSQREPRAAASGE